MADKIPHEDILLRGATVDDYNFIIASWLTSFSKSQIAKDLTHSQTLSIYAPLLEAKDKESSAYYALERLLINHCINNFKTAVACWREDPNVILGFINMDDEARIVNYVLVKSSVAEMGVAGYLLTSCGFNLNSSFTYTHSTPIAAKRLNLLKCNYDPKAIYKKR